MKIKIPICLLLALALLFTAASPAFAAARAPDAAEKCAAVGGQAAPRSVKEAFQTFIARFKAIFDGIKAYFSVKKEHVPNTMNQNAIHMLKSVTDTIGDSFIITTADGKVIAVDGGSRSETAYFVRYLQAVTGDRSPHIDAWFLSHPHDDHCEVFLEVARNHPEVSFGTVYANFPEAAFYDGYDEWCYAVIREFDELRPGFADKVVELAEGDVFSVGDAVFTVFYVFNPEWRGGNDASTIMRMDLAGTRVMFDGDASERAADYVVEKYGDSGELKCDYCKMSHHGQDGAGRNFYETVAPEVCIWPTPTWVYDNTNGNLTTDETKAWVEALGVKKEYKAFEGSCVIPMKPRIVTTTDVFEDGYPADNAVERLARLGYEGIDMGLDYWIFDGSPFLRDDYLDWCASLKAKAEAAGVSYTHAHAPGDAGDTAMVERSIRAAAALGARYLVVHPICRNENGNTIGTKLRFISVNKKAIEKVLPLAEECGVTLLSENILWGASADPRAVADLVRRVGSDRFGWCFDTGHAHCSGYGADVLLKCSVAPMSLHIQDNNGGGDEHLIPGDGTFDFDTFLATLGEIGYLGDCVMEAHHQSLDAPDEQRDAILTRLLGKSEEIRARMR